MAEPQKQRVMNYFELTEKVVQMELRLAHLEKWRADVIEHQRGGFPAANFVDDSDIGEG